MNGPLNVRETQGDKKMVMSYSFYWEHFSHIRYYFNFILLNFKLFCRGLVFEFDVGPGVAGRGAEHEITDMCVIDMGCWIMSGRSAVCPGVALELFVDQF